MQIGLSDFFRQDGLSREFRMPLEAKQFSYWGSDFGIADGSRVELTVTHQGNRVIAVTGHAALSLRMQCGRCLREVPVPFELDLDAQLDFNRSAVQEEDERPYLTGYDLDVDRLVFDALYPMMPINVLCSPDCKGICPNCGKDLNTGSCSCTPQLDPRMAKILDIYNATNKEV